MANDSIGKTQSGQYEIAGGNQARAIVDAFQQATAEELFVAVENMAATITAQAAKIVELEAELAEQKEYEAEEAAFMAKHNILYCNTFLDGWAIVLDEREELKATITRLEGALKGQWIPVSERLPEVGRRVLTWQNDVLGVMNAWRLTDGTWADANGVFVCNPTHWQPLPSPPDATLHPVPEQGKAEKVQPKEPE